VKPKLINTGKTGGEVREEDEGGGGGRSRGGGRYWWTEARDGTF